MQLRTTLCALSLGAGFCLPAYAAPCPAVTRVGISDQTDGQYRRGVANLVIEELARRTGCRFAVSWFPVARLHIQFSNRQLDMVMASLRTPGRDETGRYVPYAYTQFELLLKDSVTGRFRSLAEFVDGSTARLNLPRGISYPDAVRAQLERLEAQGRLEYVKDYGVVFNKIKVGRAEGSLVPLVVQAQRLGPVGLANTMQGNPITEAPRRLLGAYLSRTTLPDSVYSSYAHTMADMVTDGTIQKIYATALGSEVAGRVFSSGTREILQTIEY